MDLFDGVLVQYTGEAYQHTFRNGGDIKEKERTTALHHTALDCTSMHSMAQYFTAVHFTVLYCNVPR